MVLDAAVRVDAAVVVVVRRRCRARPVRPLVAGRIIVEVRVGVRAADLAGIFVEEPVGLAGFRVGYIGGPRLARELAGGGDQVGERLVERAALSLVLQVGRP